ncbi:MAG: VTT domain-containing protein [Candidatus Heimdallarchaeota archaeon]
MDMNSSVKEEPTKTTMIIISRIEDPSLSLPEKSLTPETQKKTGFFRRAKQWLLADKNRLGSLIFLLLFLILIIVLASLNLNFGSLMQSIVDWFEEKIGLIGIYFGVFLISIFGNFTVIFPIPYTLALITVAVRPTIDALDIFILGLFAGAGAALGETSAWLLGKASKNVMEDSMEKQVARAKSWIDRGLAPLIIFIFAATPLPDDAILLFIGLLGYALWKTLIWCLLGKIVLTAVTGYVAKYFAFTTFGSKILWLFGLTIEDGSVGASEPSSWLSALVWIATIVIISIILFVDWGDVWNYLTRSLYKKRLLLLVPEEKKHPKNTALVEKEQTEIGGTNEKKALFQKEEALWQCVIEKKENETPEYHDLYAIPFIVQDHLELKFRKEWFESFQIFLKEKKHPKLIVRKLSKIIVPKNLKAFYLEEEVKNQLLQKSFFITIRFKKKGVKKAFVLKYLLQQLPTNEMKITCIGEKEALTIKQIRAFDSLLVVSSLVELLSELPNAGEDYLVINIGISELNESFFQTEQAAD